MKRTILVPLMLFLAGSLMSFAWISHLKFKSWSFWTALAVSWFLVLPEYIGSDVVCCALVSPIHPKESLSPSQICGFLLMAISVALINVKY